MHVEPSHVQNLVRNAHGMHKVAQHGACSCSAPADGAILRIAHTGSTGKGACPLLAPELLRPPLVRRRALLLTLRLRLVLARVERAIIIFVDIALVVLEVRPPRAKLLRARWAAVHQVEVAVLHCAAAYHR